MVYVAHAVALRHQLALDRADCIGSTHFIFVCLGIEDLIALWLADEVANVLVEVGRLRVYRARRLHLLDTAVLVDHHFALNDLFVSVDSVAGGEGRQIRDFTDYADLEAVVAGVVDQVARLAGVKLDWKEAVALILVILKNLFYYTVARLVVGRH